MAQSVAVKTNLLYWMTSTPNIGGEVALSNHISISSIIGYNAFNFPNYYKADATLANPKLHHWLVMPEGKYWIRNTFSGNFIGIHFLGMRYNIGGLKFPKFLNEHRYEGYGIGGGISYGYQWSIARNWTLEVSIGVGYTHLNYTKYRCGNCGRKVRNHSKNYFGPDKAAVSIAYTIPSRKTPVINLSEDNNSDRFSTTDTISATGRDTIYMHPQKDAINYTHIVSTDTVCFVIHYPTNISEFKPEFGQNRYELARLDSLIKNIRLSQGKLKLQTIKVTGYASPEHTYHHNLTLSEQRAHSIAKYIESTYNGESVKIEIEGRGEDWKGLLIAISKSHFPKQNEIAVIASDNHEEDAREVKIRHTIGNLIYRRLLNEIYPNLRRTEIKIIYNSQSIYNEHSE